LVYGGDRVMLKRAGFAEPRNVLARLDGRAGFLSCSVAPRGFAPPFCHPVFAEFG